MPSRRAFLGAGLRSLVAGAAAGVPGCSEAEQALGGATSPTGSTVGPPPDYVDWLAAPGEYGLEDYVHLRHDLAAVRRNRQVLDEERYDQFVTRFEGRFGFLDLAFADVSEWLKLVEPFAAVLSVSVDVDADALEGFERAADHGSYAVYVDTEGARVVALDDGVVVVGFDAPAGTVEPRVAVEKTLDAEAGDAERYVDADADFRLLSGAVGAGAFSFGSTAVPQDDPGPPEGTVALGSRVRIDGSTADLRAGMVFDDAADTDEAAAEAAVTRERDLADVSTATTGRVVTVTGTQPADEFSFGTYST